jgi:hypothetical protein
MENFNLDFNFDFASFSDIEIDLNVEFETKYIKPPQTKKLPYKKLKYSKAEKLAKELNFKELDRAFVIVNGSFIFGDFIEAFIIENQINVLEMTISTLSYSKDNIDSLKNLINAEYIQQLNIIVSDYFFSHEKNKLIKYTYEQFENDNFQLTTAGTHCKICQFKTEGNKYIVIHGSVNLRSSGNIEQFVIEDNESLYTFNKEYQDRIIDKYKTINKTIRSKQLWQQVETAGDQVQPAKQKQVKGK